jgi:hypothetical protein
MMAGFYYSSIAPRIVHCAGTTTWCHRRKHDFLCAAIVCIEEGHPTQQAVAMPSGNTTILTSSCPGVSSQVMRCSCSRPTLNQRANADLQHSRSAMVPVA